MNRTQKIIGIFRKTAVVLWWTVTVAVAVAVVGIIAAKLRGEVPYFFGYSIMNIVSGSMGDTIPEGSYILIQKTDAADIRNGDIICFYSDEQAIRGYPNTHRVVEDPIHGANGIEFVTKGDANPTTDSVTAKGHRLIGRYVKNLNGLTSLSNMLQDNGILIISIVLPALCVAVMIASAYLKLKRQDEDQEDATVAPVSVPPAVPEVEPAVQAEASLAEPEAEPEVQEEVITAEPEAEPVVQEEVIAAEPEAEPVVQEEVIAAEPEAEPVVQEEVITAEPEAEPEVQEEVITAEPEAEQDKQEAMPQQIREKSPKKRPIPPRRKSKIVLTFSWMDK